MSLPVLVLSALLAPALAVTLLNLVAAPRLHRVRPARSATGDTGPDPASILVPARDEAANLRRLLPALVATGPEALEILVLDDGSTDETAAVVRHFAARDPRIRLVAGSEPPDGWTGKNWACHQLALQARGDVVIFCDADVRPSPRAVSRTVRAMAESRADALTAIPRHEPGGRFERAVIPLVATVPVLALLPLPLVHRTRAVSIAMGNGQWFAWRRAAYHSLGGHARVRSDVLEDVRLARLAKRHGLRLAAYLAPRDLRIRMYRDRASTREGFVKNLYLLAGGRPWTLGPALAVLLVAGLGPLVAVLTAPTAGPLALVPILELVTIRLAAARLVADDLSTVILHPAGVLAVAALAVESWHRHRRGTVAWKRRALTHREVA